MFTQAPLVLNAIIGGGVINIEPLFIFHMEVLRASPLSHLPAVGFLQSLLSAFIKLSPGWLGSLIATG